DSLARYRTSRREQLPHSLGTRQWCGSQLHHERATAHPSAWWGDCMKLITHLDPSQLRLGYLSCLSLVGGRQLDTRQGLVDRLCRFLFATIEDRDPRWTRFLDRADPD